MLGGHDCCPTVSQGAAPLPVFGLLKDFGKAGDVPLGQLQRALSCNVSVTALHPLGELRPSRELSQEREGCRAVPPPPPDNTPTSTCDTPISMGPGMLH